MLNMVKKNGVASPREGTASAVREAARSGVPESAISPDRPKRRTFAPEYKLRVVREADAALASGVEGAIGELLRREGLYSSHLTTRLTCASPCIPVATMAERRYILYSRMALWRSSI